MATGAGSMMGTDIQFSSLKLNTISDVQRVLFHYLSLRRNLGLSQEQLSGIVLKDKDAGAFELTLSRNIPEAARFELARIFGHFHHCHQTGRTLIAEKDGVIVALASLSVFPASQFGITRAADEQVGLIGIFRITPHEGDVQTAKRILVCLADVAGQLGLKRMVYKASAGAPHGLSPHTLLGEGRHMGFERYGETGVAGLTAFYTALGLFKPPRDRGGYHYLKLEGAT